MSKKMKGDIIAAMVLLLIIAGIYLAFKIFSGFWQGEFVVLDITETEVIQVGEYSGPAFFNNQECNTALTREAQQYYNDYTVAHPTHAHWITTERAHTKSYRVVCKKKPIWELLNTM
jgi:hypothetical protein